MIINSFIWRTEWSIASIKSRSNNIQLVNKDDKKVLRTRLRKTFAVKSQRSKRIYD